MHAAPRPRGTAWTLEHPCSSIQTTSPGSTSRTQLSPDEVERARLRGDDPVVADPTERERPDPERVAEGHEHPVRDRDHRVRPLESLHRRRDGLRQRCRVARDKRGDHLGVRARREPDSVREQLLAQGLGVDEVAVVAERDRSRRAVEDEGLRIRPAGAPRRRVARVADRDLAGKRGELLLVEHLRHEPHLAHCSDPPAFVDRDPGRFLAAVLKREQAEVREARDVALDRSHAEDAAHQPAPSCARPSSESVSPKSVSPPTVPILLISTSPPVGSGST